MIYLEGLSFKPLTEKDLALVFKWLGEAHVKAWWGERDSFEEVCLKYRKKIAAEWQQPLIVSTAGQPFGYLQYYCVTCSGEGRGGWWSNEASTTFGIDQFIGEPEYLFKGLGTQMVKSFSDWLLTQPDCKKIISDPSPDNVAAIRCYSKAGFRSVGEIDTPNGRALLMEKEGG